MIQLSSFLWFCIILFALIGYLRGFDKEAIALSGIMLALFTVVQFESFFAQLGAQGGLAQTFYLKAIFLGAVSFFAYQTPPDKFVKSRRQRDSVQERLLGSVLGGVNGYLLFGSLWYFMDQLQYPLAPHITTPPVDSPSAGMVDLLPLVWLHGGLLTAIFLGMFVFIIVFVI